MIRRPQRPAERFSRYRRRDRSILVTGLICFSSSSPPRRRLPDAVWAACQSVVGVPSGNLRLRVVVLAAWLGMMFQAGAEELDQPILSWKNGDRLAGELLGADADTIQWKSPLFCSPFTLQVEQLSSVRFPDRANGRQLRFAISSGHVVE